MISPDDIKLDKTGFPMIWLDEIDAYIHWLPVSKVQFEHFLCDSPGVPFDEEWYDQVLQLNERITPKRARKNNYWQLFLSGIKPNEVEWVVEWFGDEYEIPSLDEWNQAYRSLKAMPSVDHLFQNTKLNERARTILTKIDEITKAIYRRRQRRTIADQMLMRLGVMEWVRCQYRGREWGGMGQTPSGFHSMIRTPDSGTPETVRDPLGIRLGYYGFRLLRR